MKNELPENIQKLLKSSVIEDLIIGVEWCYNNLGQQWCLDNFNNGADAEPNYTEEYPYPTPGYDTYSVVWDDIEIFIGYAFISASRAQRIPISNNVINNKTK